MPVPGNKNKTDTIQFYKFMYENKNNICFPGAFAKKNKK